MLDNPGGSSESELVQRLKSARSSEEQTSAPDEGLTDETGGEPQAELEREAEEEASETEEAEASEEVEEQEYFTVKAAGEELEVSFDELVEGYQKGRDYYKKTSTLAEERKEFEATQNKELEALATEKQKYLELVGKLDSIVNDQEKDAQYWEDLRNTDPSEYLRQKEDIEAKKQLVEDAKKDHRQQLQKQRQELVNKNAQMLTEKVGDEWADESAKAKDLDGMFSYVSDLGVTQEEASNIFDHRFWLMVRDAMRYREGQKAVDVVKKQVRTAPKTVKSKQKVRARDQDFADIRKRVKASGGKSENDLVALLQSKRIR